MAFRILGVSGGLGVPSRTSAVVQALLAGIAARPGFETEFVELRREPHLFGAFARAEVGEAGERLLRKVETADALVVGSPIYRGSYAGIFKHLFDLVDRESLAGKPVILAATGGSWRHALAIEHQFRPLFGFFGALVAPTAVYAAPEDFSGEALAAPLEERIARTAAEAVRLVQGWSPARPETGARPAIKEAV